MYNLPSTEMWGETPRLCMYMLPNTEKWGKKLSLLLNCSEIDELELDLQRAGGGLTDSLTDISSSLAVEMGGDKVHIYIMTLHNTRMFLALFFLQPCVTRSFILRITTTYL